MCSSKYTHLNFRTQLIVWVNHWQFCVIKLLLDLCHQDVFKILIHWSFFWRMWHPSVDLSVLCLGIHQQGKKHGSLCSGIALQLSYGWVLYRKWSICHLQWPTDRIRIWMQARYWLFSQYLETSQIICYKFCILTIFFSAGNLTSAKTWTHYKLLIKSKQILCLSF